MKTAISIPDNVYQSAEKLADRLGTSRSQLYTQAIKNYLAQHQKEAITKQLNKVYAQEGAEIDDVLMEFQFKSLPKEDW